MNCELSNISSIVVIAKKFLAVVVRTPSLNKVKRKCAFSHRPRLRSPYICHK